MPQQPFVSVITPVHNGACYLTECIESVLAQTYQNWEYVIVDNCSSDESAAIAAAYAQRDFRIRLAHTGKLLRAPDSWNYALTQISPRSEYCKIVHADDWIFPECIARMVELAIANPSVILVSSYRLLGNKLDNNQLTRYPNSVFRGRDAARWFLREKHNVFGNPSSILIRSDAVRRRSVFYQESNEIRQAMDIQACLEVLKDGDLGFVHQVLTFSRLHTGSLSTSLAAFMLEYPERLHFLQQFGSFYLDDDEYQMVWKEAVAEYAHMLALCIFFGKPSDFWEYHRGQQELLGITITPLTIAREACWRVVLSITRPIRRLMQWRKQHRRLDRARIAAKKKPASVKVGSEETIQNPPAQTTSSHRGW
jgi:glycosyltransferase involved in cell wall biosynthesis